MSRRWSLFARLASAVGRWGRGRQALVVVVVLLAVSSLAVAAGRGISGSTPLLGAVPTPTTTPTLEPTATPTLEPTATPTPTPIPTATPIPRPTPIPTHLRVVVSRDCGPGSGGWPALLLTSRDPDSLAVSYQFRAYVKVYNADGTLFMIYSEDVTPGRTIFLHFYYEPLSLGKLPIKITTEWFEGRAHPESPGHWEGTLLPC